MRLVTNDCHLLFKAFRLCLFVKLAQSYNVYETPPFEINYTSLINYHQLIREHSSSQNPYYAEKIVFEGVLERIF
jgi:hypothetical protein